MTRPSGEIKTLWKELAAKPKSCGKTLWREQNLVTRPCGRVKTLWPNLVAKENPCGKIDPSGKILVVSILVASSL